MYLLPYQNAAFYLAHEFGHQLGLVHQVDSSCYTKFHMSVMTNSHTASYERARWTICENNWINNNICQFECLFNKPDNYQPIKNKYSTLPGKRMNNNQQAKMIESNEQNIGEILSFTYMSSDLTSRCLYFGYYIGGLNSGEICFIQINYLFFFLEYKLSFSPMLPGSNCGNNSICYLDQCISMNNLDLSLLNIEYDTEILDLTTYCSSNGDSNVLKDSNHDPHHAIECINWENDFLCEKSRLCPKSDDSSIFGLYIKHVCCEKCSSKSNLDISAFNQARRKAKCSIIISICLIFFLL
jgi:hypothetical protein